MVILVLYNKLQLGSLHSGEALLRARAVLRRVTVGQWLTGEGSLISCGCHWSIEGCGSVLIPQVYFLTDHSQ